MKNQFYSTIAIIALLLMGLYMPVRNLIDDSHSKSAQTAIISAPGGVTESIVRYSPDTEIRAVNVSVTPKKETVIDSVVIKLEAGLKNPVNGLMIGESFIDHLRAYY